MRKRTMLGIGLWAIAGSGLVSLAFFQPVLAAIPGALWTVITIYGLASIGYKFALIPIGPVGSMLGKAARFGLLVPLLSKFYPEHLENQNRKDILSYLEKNPGASIQEVREASNIAWGTAVYHLERLRRQESVVGHRHGNHHRFWVKNTPESRVRQGWSVLEQPTARDVAMAVASSPGSHQGAICEAVNIRAPSASKHLSRLEAHGLVEKQKVSRYTVYRATDTLEQLLAMRGDYPADRASPDPAIEMVS